jgi:catechol 2,3-dioxygenase-like lactoylglutathione lyase family enzyme
MPTYVTSTVNAPMTDLENFRKQAKRYLRWHRDGYHPVAAQIRAVLPRFRDLDDREVMSTAFKLADAQEMVARQSGFESWGALKTGAKAMASNMTSGETKPAISRTEAQLFVTDISATCAFFTGKLGFEVVFAYGDPPFYAQVRRDAGRVNLRLVCEPVYVGDVREREHLLSTTMALDSGSALKQLYLKFQEAGVDFHQTLKNEPWGARTFIVRDPDGNLLLFAGPADG